MAVPAAGPLRATASGDRVTSRRARTAARGVGPLARRSAGSACSTSSTSSSARARSSASSARTAPARRRSSTSSRASTRRTRATSSSRAESILGLDPHKITKRGIARTFQTLRLFLNMTVKENVMAAAYGHTQAGVARARSCARRACAARSARSTQLAEERLVVLRRAARRLPLEPARVQPLVREPAPARDRPRDGDQAAAAPARRAGRRA